MECNTSFYACDFRRGPAISMLFAYLNSPEVARDGGQQVKHIIPVLREIRHRVFTAVNELLPDTCLRRSCFSGSEKLIRLR